MIKKSLGQHFLIDNNIKNMIVNALEIKEHDNIIEIGPGPGALTEKLILKNINLTVVEKDSNLAIKLASKFPNIKIINEDFLKWELPDNLKHIKIIGNLPYNVSTQIIFKILENYNLFNYAVFMVQKEVADRILANSNTKDFSLLSVIVQAYSKPEKLFNVSPNCFYPKPKVLSTVFRMKIFNKFQIKNFKQFFLFVKALFYGKRKKLVNVLNNNPYIKFNEEIIKYYKENFNINYRVSNLSIDDIVSIYRKL